MALQELDLHLHYQPGKVNKNVDALSRGPVQAQSVGIDTTDDTECVVDAITDPLSESKDGDEDMTLARKQSSDFKLRPIIQYLREGILLDDERSARELEIVCIDG